MINVGIVLYGRNIWYQEQKRKKTFCAKFLPLEFSVMGAESDFNQILGGKPTFQTGKGPSSVWGQICQTFGRILVALYEDGKEQWSQDE